jgi:hypothetical protein
MTTLLTNLNGLPGPTRRLPLASFPPLPRPAREDALEQLKTRLLVRTMATAADPTESLLAQRAAYEAASLAWSLPYPLLVFPALFEEKLQAARRVQAFQATVRRRSLEVAFSE